jgi:hypothetical protein
VYLAPSMQATSLIGVLEKLPPHRSAATGISLCNVTAGGFSLLLMNSKGKFTTWKWTSSSFGSKCRDVASFKLHSLDPPQCSLQSGWSTKKCGVVRCLCWESICLLRHRRITKDKCIKVPAEGTRSLKE